MTGNHEWGKVTCIFKENLHFAQNLSNGLLLCPKSALKFSLNLFIKFELKKAQPQKFYKYQLIRFPKLYVMTSSQKEAKVTVFIFQDNFDYFKEPRWILSGRILTCFYVSCFITLFFVFFRIWGAIFISH